MQRNIQAAADLTLDNFICIEYDVEPWDDVEIHPVCVTDSNGNVDVCDTADADYWSVQLHLCDGKGHVSVADLPTEELAIKFADMIEFISKQYKQPA